MKTIMFKSFAVLAVSALSFATSVAKSQDLKPKDSVASDVAALALAQAAQAPTGDGDERQAVRGLLNSSIDYLLPTFGEDAPDYLKRVEFDIQLQENLKPEWSILTVQPLYQTESKEHTVFTQLSQRRYNYLGLDRDVSNLGLGYRKLFADDAILVGVNTFLDYEWERQHKRGGFGFEVKWAGLDFTTNAYRALSNKTGKGLSGDTQEEVLDGHDFELSAQLPYLPWARVHGKRYYWDSVAAAEDVKGWTVSLEADVQQNLRVEVGYTDDNFIARREHFIQLAFRIPFGAPRPTMTSSAFVSDQAWAMRDMREYTLEKVRRQNKIILEQSGSGVVITRGS